MRWILLSMLVLAIAAGCKKDKEPVRYFEVGMRLNGGADDWRDTAFVVATSNQQVLNAVDAELAKPIADRKKLVSGKLKKGSGGYNKNAGFTFNWHLEDWTLTDLTIELIDGRPYSDVELHNSYWMDTVKSFGSWGSYIKKEIK